MTTHDPTLQHTRTRRSFLLMGVLVLTVAILFPPRSIFYRLLIEDLNLKSLFPYLMHYYPMTGGLAGQALFFIRMASAHSTEASEFLLVLVVSCLATLCLTLCIMVFWRWLVDRRSCPTLLHVLMAVLLAVGSSLALTLILCCFEVVITALITNKEIMVGYVLVIAGLLIVAQVLLTPILLIGGVILMKWQRRTERLWI